MVLSRRRRSSAGGLGGRGAGGGGARCWTPGPLPLSRPITIASARWKIEEDHQLSKQVVGLDAGQVIRWKSWHRWTALCLLAYLYLAVAAASQRQHDVGSGLIPVTVPELLRLLRGTVIPQPRRDRAHRLHWSDRQLPV